MTRTISTLKRFLKKLNIRGAIKKRVLLSIFDQLDDVTSSMMEYVNKAANKRRQRKRKRIQRDRVVIKGARVDILT